MKKFVPLFILLLFLGAGKAAASTYTVSFRVKMIGVGGDEIFRGDTMVRFHTSGNDPKERHTIYASNGREIAVSFEIRPGGKDPSMKKYGVKGKTWKYKSHIWMREEDGEWKEVSSDSIWMYLQRQGEAEVTSTVNSAGKDSFAIKYRFSIEQD